MRIDLCRKCGKELEVNKKCEICRDAKQFFCHHCGNITEEQIHLQCMLVEPSYKLLDIPLIR